MTLAQTRRGFLTAVGGGLAAMAVAGCTNSELDQPAAGSTAGTPSKAAGSQFPVTVTHRFGSTTIPAEPRRIVALGQTDCDPLIALGITPIAIGSFVESWYEPVHPWNEDGFPSPPTQLNFLEPEFEKIAALQPDLITMVSGGITQKAYATLSQIAPVVGPPEGFQDSAVPYADHTILIGQTVGREDDARAIVADVDAKYAAAREAHPEWDGLTAVHAECYTGAYDVLGVNAPRTTFLTALGFVLSPELDRLTGDLYSKEISPEKLDLVGGLDLVVWNTDEGAIPDLKSNAVVSGLPVVEDGHSVWITYAKTCELMWAMDWNTVLSAGYAIEHGVPLVEAARNGQGPTAEGA